MVIEALFMTREIVKIEISGHRSDVHDQRLKSVVIEALFMTREFVKIEISGHGSIVHDQRIREN